MHIGLKVLAAEAYLAFAVEQAICCTLVLLLLVRVLSHVRRLLEFCNDSAAGLRSGEIVSGDSLVLLELTSAHAHSTHAHLLDRANLGASTSQEALVCAHSPVVVVGIIETGRPLSTLVRAAHG